MKALGRTSLVEFYNCATTALDDRQKMVDILLKSAELSGATVIKNTSFHFTPQGVSAIVVIAESHFAIHTWPEYSYCAVDMFTCGEAIDESKAMQYLKKALQAKSVSVVEVKRGILDMPPDELKHKMV